MATEGGPKIIRDGLEFIIDPANEKSTGGFLRDQNILDYSTWQLNGTSATGFSRNGSTNENIIISGTGPFGETTLIWEARPSGGNNADGGWNGSRFDIDHTKKYRFSVWVKRTVYDDGRFYFGLRGYNSSTTNVGVYRSNNTTSYTNPYSYVTSDPPSTGQLPSNTWVLVVFHVWPSSTGNVSMDSDSGRYTVADGRIGGVSLDFKWRTDNTQALHRTYLYYSSATTPRQQWVYPRVDLIDGTEPSVQDLLDGKSRTLTNLANPSNTVFQVNNLKIKTSDYFNHRRNRVLDFDGTDDLITTSFGSGRNVANNPFTVTAWVKADVTNANMMWVDVGGNGSNQRFYSTLINGSSRNFGIQATGWSDSQPDDTNWHHQAIVMDGNTARGYNNGVQVQTLGYTSYTLPGAIRFGGRSGYYWNGQIAKTKIYNKALSAKQIARDYNASKRRFGL